MNKQEAIAAMKRGKTITHRSFTNEEFMKMIDDQTLVFEDGVECDLDEFFGIRADEQWEERYSIYKPRKVVLTCPVHPVVDYALQYLHSPACDSLKTDWRLEGNHPQPWYHKGSW